MNIVTFKNYDILNGEGIRCSLWVSGCPHACEGCHNKEFWGKDKGYKFNPDKHIKKIKDVMEKDNVSLSVLGGEPLAPYNIEEVTLIVKEIKKEFPNRDIWLWTGYKFEEIKEKEILKYIDVLVDGKYEEKLNTGEDIWRGSSNQRVINVRETLEKKNIILYCK